MVNKDDSLDVRKEYDDCYHHLTACIKKHKEVLEYIYNYYYLFNSVFSINSKSDISLSYKSIDSAKIWNLRIRQIFFSCWP